MIKWAVGDKVQVARGPLAGRIGVVTHKLLWERLFVVSFNGIERTFAESELA